MSYAPLIDRERRTFGTRLTMLSVKPTDRLPVGLILEQLNGMWPESRALVLVAPLDAQLDDSLLEWQAPRERRRGDSDDCAARPCRCRASCNVRIGLASRWRCAAGPTCHCLRRCSIASNYALIHITEDRRRRSDGTNAAPPPGVMRRMPFIITGAFRVDELHVRA